MTLTRCSLLIFLTCLVGSLLAATPSAMAQTTPQPTPLLRGTPTPLLRGTATPPTVATARITPTATATSSGERYQIDRRVVSAQLPAIGLTLRSVASTDRQLILRVAFENQTDEPLRFSFITPVEQRHIHLLDSRGTRYPATRLDPTWAAVQPQGGFASGGANPGTIAFARPIGPGPYRLAGIFTYPPIEFILDQPEDEIAPIAIPAGIYPVNRTLFSNDEVLEPLRLTLETVTLTDDAITFAVAFLNTTYQHYGLRSGPTGSDAALLDAERSQSRPSSVSFSLRDGITPNGGIAPGEAYRGTITFPRPARLTEARFTFSRYTPLLLHFDRRGLRDHTLSIAANGTPPPTPTPQADVAIYNALDRLLTDQAAALLKNEPATFLQGVTAAARPTIAAVVTELAAMPLATVELALLPDQSFDLTGQNELRDLEVALRYTFVGVPADNLFVEDFRVDFVQVASGTERASWQISALEPEGNTPFWWGGPVTFYEAPHFLIFTRPDRTTDRQILADEVEAAYASIERQGLSLEARYVAYFTAPEDSFAQYTGATNPNILGVALSRYQLNPETLNVVSRAFYINGSNFTEEAQIQQRQSTITHELVHLALAIDSRPFTPPWLAEGLAVYYAGQKSAASHTAAYNQRQLESINLATLTTLSSLGVHAAVGEQTSYRYLYSGAVIAYLVETYSEDAVWRFYRTYTQVSATEIRERLPSAVDPSQQEQIFQRLSLEVTEAALAATFGLTLTELDEAVKLWLLADR